MFYVHFELGIAFGSFFFLGLKEMFVNLVENVLAKNDQYFFNFSQKFVE